MSSWIEGVDYTIENGRYIFSESYLRRRGECCGSGCRNCPYPGKARIVSMVPSLTETLAACGANVVGRTRFCIHGAPSAALVGGTKSWNLETVSSLNPDLVVLDRQENPKTMAVDSLPWIASEILSARDVAPFLRAVSARLRSLEDYGVAARLDLVASRWEVVVNLPPRSTTEYIDWVSRPVDLGEVTYVIWREPLMRVTRDTFIGSVLEMLGFRLWKGEVKDTLRYPEFNIEEVPRDVTLLFSSEPYPFARHREWISDLARPSGLVDGECFSWFGIRSLRFLESVLGTGR